MSYNGKRFYCSGIESVKNYDIWWGDEYKEKKEFTMTFGYRKYLKDKKEREKKEELMVLRSKLEYQMKKYGQVDEIDFQEYMTKVKMWG